MNTKADFRERTKRFAASVIRLYAKLDGRKEEQRVLGRQVLRAATSVAANYREASRARSPQEFIAKIELCTQEVDETQLWLELLREECDVPENLVNPIWRESEELLSILVVMAKNTKRNCHELKT